jgi:putative nucleotidyltransferase with HDIG domain
MNDKMERVNRILKHPEFLPRVRDIEELERARIFCGHGMDHLMAVARLAYIENLEMGYGISRETIYAAALLHDLGRKEEYLTGVDHHRAGLALAKRMLCETGFSGEESDEILEAIAHHGNSAMKQETGLKGLLYRADKKSRRCWDCPAVTECDWEPEKRNNNLEV